VSKNISNQDTFQSRIDFYHSIICLNLSDLCYLCAIIIKFSGFKIQFWKLKILFLKFAGLKLKTMSEIASKVKSIIVDKLGVDEKEVTETAKFTDLGADSLDTVELIMEFEKEFNIAIPDEQAEKISTVGEAIAYIEANVQK